MLKLKKPGIIFDEVKHTYQKSSDLKYLPGVTTIIGILSKPYLMAWSTKENYNYLLKNWDITKQYSKEEKEELLYEAKNAYLRKSKEAANIGKEVHEYLSKYVKAKTKPNIKVLELPTNLKSLNAVKSFFEWEKKSRIKWLLSEVIIASTKYEFAGTLDALAYVDDKLTLIDFKTSSRISSDYYLQTAGYQIALEEMGLVPEQRLILRFPKDATEFEHKIVPTPLDFDKETFLHLREVQRWISYNENKIKVENNNK